MNVRVCSLWSSTKLAYFSSKYPYHFRLGCLRFKAALMNMSPTGDDRAHTVSLGVTHGETDVMPCVLVICFCVTLKPNSVKQQTLSRRC